MEYVVSHGEETLKVSVEERDDGRFKVSVDGREVVADLRSAGGRSLYSLLLGHEAFEVGVVQAEERTRVSLRGRDLNLLVESEQERNARLLEAATGGGGPQTIKSVMPGRVVRVLVRPGEDVGPGTPLLILEAMKMENEIRATGEGTVETILVEEGSTVAQGEALIRIS